MALINYGPFVSNISGKVGNTVCSRWKGRSYIRERVIPANPQSVDQTTQRNFLAKVVAWWHDIKSALKLPCDELGATWSVSGFNAWVARNLKDMADGVDERIMPLNTPINPIDNISADTGAGVAGDIDLIWDQGEADAGHDMFALCEKSGTPAGQGAMIIKDLAVTADAEAGVVSDLDAGIEYNVWLFVNRPEAGPLSDMYSIARKATATSKA